MLCRNWVPSGNRQMNGVNIGHQVAKHGAAAAARGFGAMRHLFVEIDQAVAGVDGRRSPPNPPARQQILNRIDQPLVAQVADHQRFRRGAERHRCEDFALVHVDRQRVLTGDRGGARGAVLVTRGDFKRGRSRALA